MSFAIPAAGLGKLIDTKLPAEQLPHDNHLDVWDARTGTFLPGFPHLSDDLQFFTNPAIGDVNGDGLPEVLCGSGGYLVHAVDASGAEAPRWPKFTGNWIIAAPAFGQFGGRRVVAVSTREAQLFVWRVRGKPTTWAWERFHHDARNTGLFTR